MSISRCGIQLDSIVPRLYRFISILLVIVTDTQVEVRRWCLMDLNRSFVCDLFKIHEKGKTKTQSECRISNVIVSTETHLGLANISRFQCYSAQLQLPLRFFDAGIL
jgi:hypothetical protein